MLTKYIDESVKRSPLEIEKEEEQRNKKRTNEVNEIEKIYVQEGVHSEKFTRQLLDFISFVLNRYSADNSFPDDMVHFTYLRIMERLGVVRAERPKVPTRIEKQEDGSAETIDTILEWEINGRECLFDISRSNLGNYIFSIARHAHSNYMYHNSKKFKELEPPPVELSEQEIFDEYQDESQEKVLCYINKKESNMPLNIRRYLIWKQNT